MLLHCFRVHQKKTPEPFGAGVCGIPILRLRYIQHLPRDDRMITAILMMPIMVNAATLKVILQPIKKPPNLFGAGVLVSVGVSLDEPPPPRHNNAANDNNSDEGGDLFYHDKFLSTGGDLFCQHLFKKI